MPIYEYKCQDCGKVFEAIQKFSDPELTTCRCEKAAPVKKLISAAAFHLKGSGWYVTDFRDKDKKKPGAGSGDDSSSSSPTTASESSSSTKDSKKPESKTDSKSETKTTPKADSSGKSAAAD